MSSKSKQQLKLHPQHMVTFFFCVCKTAARSLSYTVSVTEVNKLQYFKIIIFTNIS